MTLKIELREQERVVIGDVVIINATPGRAELVIEGTAPVLREKDILNPADVDTVAKRVYLLVQSMYLARTPSPELQNSFATIVEEMVTAAPSTRPYLEKISNLVLAGRMYNALKATRELIEYENTLIRSIGEKKA